MSSMYPSTVAKPDFTTDLDIDSDESSCLEEGDEVPPRLDVMDGELAFVSPEMQMQRTAELLGAGAVVVNVPPLPTTFRGRLAEHVGERIERELAARGAPSPYLAAWSAMPDDAQALLADQLFRARTVGATGIALILGTLANAAVPSLTPEDSATLRLFTMMSRQAPLAVLLDDTDVNLGGYAAPLPLEVLLSTPRITPPPSSFLSDVAELVPTNVDAPVAPVETVETPVIANELLSTEADISEHVLADADIVSIEVDEDADAASLEEPFAEAAVAVDVPVATVEPAQESARRRARASTVGVPASGPSDFWRSWAMSLSAARGPQPLAALERLFAESYVPLANTIAAGLDDARAMRAYDEFRRSFERTYTDAFATFGVSSRRPKLVMDAYDVASKLARLHNARTTQVLIVDSMRFDLGGLVRDALAQRVGHLVSLASETLLWSALPTTTFRQLETLARGMDALRAPAAPENSESLRGRVAENVRRVRVGSREFFKLDIVPAMLASLPDHGPRGGSEHTVAALEAIAENVADGLARHVETLAPRTMLLVIGDHGFTIDRRGRIEEGGSSPEEVLVPAFAYLAGDLH
ncbi:hypothetical protein AKJ09_07512 [Labilithrix luteola]|uniref:PglZ domain-containing protein n=1 Tax=Labilithrix luteola TaxID=1391654 RepID=A0A0K1Q557_9BACT|nr:hypothetical protein [Labilithrix luteola]AKV00849.1 hypothetical protein AKJ09_07512 [Labilithrix luteola]